MTTRIATTRIAILVAVASAASILTSAVQLAAQPPAPQQQAASPQQEMANTEIARRIGVLTIDNAHLAAAVQTLVDRINALQEQLKSCPAPSAPPPGP
jgi:hypothetical protein